MFNEAKKYERRRDLNGLELRVTAETWKPYMELVERNGSLIRMKGFMAELFYGFQEIMNFTYTLTRPPDGAWGFQDDLGEWTGMIGQIVKGEVDISPTGFVLMEERQKVVDYFEAIFIADAKIFFPNPNNSYNWLAYLSPLVWQVWATIALLMLLMPLVITISAQLPPRDFHSQEFTLHKSYIFVFGALTFIRRWSVTPETMSTRVIFLLITISGLLLQFHWKAGIISQLTVNEVKMPFDDLDGVLKSNHKLLIYPAGNMVTEFEAAEKDSTMGKLWERDLKEKIRTWPRNYDGLVDLTMNEGYR